MKITTGFDADTEEYRAGNAALTHTESQERLERAKAGLPDLPTERPNVVRDYAGASCWPPFHDPRQESAWVKESGREEWVSPAEVVQPAPVALLPNHDHHVRRHFMLIERQDEFRRVIELGWVWRTGRIQSVLKSGKVGGPDGVDRAAIAAEYLVGTPGFGELLWPILVAVAEWKFTKAQWGNIVPSFRVARALWNGFALSLSKRLAAESFESYYERRARELTTIAESDHLEDADAANFSLTTAKKGAW